MTQETNVNEAEIIVAVGSTDGLGEWEAGHEQQSKGRLKMEPGDTVTMDGKTQSEVKVKTVTIYKNVEALFALRPSQSRDCETLSGDCGAAHGRCA